MTKNVSIIDESGRLIGPTYPKRAKGLVKSGRARYVSCESEDTICLTCPPDIMEDKTMTDNSYDVTFAETTEEPATEPVAVQSIPGEYTPSAEYALRMLERIALDTEAIKCAVTQVSAETDNGVAQLIESREQTNRELIKFYTQMYNQFKPTAPAQKSNTVTRFLEIADMMKGLKKEDYDEEMWRMLQYAAKNQLSRNY